MSRNVTSDASAVNGGFSCTFPLLFAHTEVKPTDTDLLNSGVGWQRWARLQLHVRQCWGQAARAELTLASALPTSPFVPLLTEGMQFTEYRGNCYYIRISVNMLFSRCHLDAEKCVLLAITFIRWICCLKNWRYCIVFFHFHSSTSLHFLFILHLLPFSLRSCFSIFMKLSHLFLFSFSYFLFSLWSLSYPVSNFSLVPTQSDFTKVHLFKYRI